MMQDGIVGTYNMVNPGCISHNEILQEYKNIVDNTFTWKNFTEEEQNEILLSGRSNNWLSETKLLNCKKSVPDIHTSVRNMLHSMKERVNGNLSDSLSSIASSDTVEIEKDDEILGWRGI